MQAPPVARPGGDAMRALARKQWEGARDAKARGLYDARWRRVRVVFLNTHPFCAMCERADPPRATIAEVVDHIEPHKGDPGLFWDQANWQALCKPCHDGDKQALERAAAQQKL